MTNILTSQRSRTYTTPLGTFVFRGVPCHDPKAGVRAVRLSPNAWARIALPLRAIADLVSLRKDVVVARLREYAPANGRKKR